jgi:hypothetical protein
LTVKSFGFSKKKMLTKWYILGRVIKLKYNNGKEELIMKSFRCMLRRGDSPKEDLENPEPICVVDDDCRRRDYWFYRLKSGRRPA